MGNIHIPIWNLNLPQWYKHFKYLNSTHISK
jgi:hypothetical protein